ncbi:MAG: DUF3784 domain-containing protein [Prevotella sp.]|nr:DUF3784 domain-containing protein [Prevotella sp.]
MIVGVTICIVLAFILVIFAWRLWTGKGDELIAGYNTAPKEERDTVNIIRLRRLMSILTVFTAFYCTLLPFLGTSVTSITAATGILFCFSAVIIVLANTWAKKK